MEADLILKALEMSLNRLEGIIAAMSRKGICYDNTHVESFFASLKTELVYRRNF
ncbi:MAG: hypothetical protein IPJ71_12645 [Bdellovibrionales bacterium]|nr:hypothetical protein [Bdellovibrionales bacterium]